MSIADVLAQDLIASVNDLPGLQHFFFQLRGRNSLGW